MYASEFKYNLVAVILCLAVFNVKLVRCQCPISDSDDDDGAWQCDSGECIDENKKCDGVPHCKDGSDEIPENCIHLKCPAYGFRCAYGGCLAGKAKCNKITECADGSDEHELLCSTDTELIRDRLKGNCTEDFTLQCDSGECIDRSVTCDGRLDCDDGSDEVVKLCSTTYCPSYAFQCGYGGCIKGSAKCNGVRDCPDGSDEAWELCKYDRKPGNYLLYTTSTTTTTTRRPTKPAFFGGGCNLPNNMANIVAINLQTRNPISLGSTVTVNTAVNFACDKTYNLIGRLNIFCQENGWSDDIPTCTKFCSRNELEMGVSSVANCYYQDSLVKCNNLIRPGTIARIECAYGFDKPTGREFVSELECMENAQWSRQKPACEMLCGKITSDDVTPFVFKGKPVNITKVPWHVGIYSSFEETSPFDYTCGGTILSPYLVLSAAHCFWNGAGNSTFAAEFYAVVAGKYYRDYQSNEEYFPPQRVNITNIIVDPRYRDRATYFEYDLAILRLSNHLRFTESIAPICLNFQKDVYKYVHNDISGTFAGWGITEEQNLAEELRRVSMKTLSHEECDRKIRSSDTGYVLPGDKFCVINDFKETACRGDSGGGFIYELKSGSKVLEYQLMGIISNVPLKAQDCSRDTVVVMTNIQYYENIIKREISNYVSIVPKH